MTFGQQSSRKDETGSHFGRRLLMLVNKTDSRKVEVGCDGSLRPHLFLLLSSYREDKTTEFEEESKTQVSLSIWSLSIDNL